MNSQKNSYDFSLLELVANNVIGLYQLAEMIYTSHLFGFPDTLTRNISIYMDQNVQSLENLRRDIDDADTSTLLSQVLVTIQALLKNDKSMKVWVENFTGRPMSTIRKTTKLSIQKQNQHGEFSGESSLPIWTRDHNYKAFLEQSSSLMKSLIDQIELLFRRVNNKSNGTIKNWSEEQRKKGRFQYIN